MGSEQEEMNVLSPIVEANLNMTHCVCGLLMRPDAECCDECLGVNAIEFKGKIIKKQKKDE